MKKILLLFLLLNSACVFSQTVSIDALRRDYQQVKTDSVSCAKLYKKINSANNTDAASLAFKGAITASMANYLTDKKEKIKLFNTGKKLIEESIHSDSTNIETRFLRFTIQTNCPKALGYNKQINTDKSFILKNYSSISSVAVKKMVHTFLLQSKELTEIEKQKLK